MKKKKNEKKKSTTKKIEKKNIEKKVEKNQVVVKETNTINTKSKKQQGNTEEVNELITDAMMKFSLYVCKFRSFPYLEDGLKCSQRKCLYTAYKMGLMNNFAHSQPVIGKMLEINPHAEDYGTLVRMTDKNETLLTPFFQGQGSFGKHYSTDGQPAAARYTSVKLMPICHELFDDLARNKENMVDNYDGTCKEPNLLSAPFPNILANSNMGIAVGFACNFGSFNLRELCDASIETIKNFSKSDKELLKIIRKVMPTMDFTTGGETYINDEEIEKLYITGQGAISCRATFNNDEKNRILEILSIPYSTSIENIIDAIIKAYKTGRIDEISGVRDETDIKGLKIAIDYKKGTDIEALKKKLYALTPCQENFNANQYLVYKNAPQCLGVVEIIKHWIEHRREWVKIVLQNELEEKKAKLHLLEGLQKILLDIDKAIKIVRQSKTDEEVITGLEKAFKIDEIQAEFVAEIKLRNLNKDYILNKTKEIKALKDEIKELEDTIKNGIDKKMIKDLEEVKKKYGVDRKTKIVNKWEEIEAVSIKAPKKEVKTEGNSIVFTSNNSVKVVDESSSASTPSGYTKNVVANTGEVLIFTNKFKVFKWNVNKFKEGSITKIADIKKINKKLEAGEEVIYTYPLMEKDKLVVIFENKKAVKFSLSQFITSGGKFCFTKGLNVKQGSILFIEAIKEDKDITVNGKTINTSVIKEVQSKTGAGAKIKI